MTALLLSLLLDLADLSAMVWQESRFDARAVSERGACGLLQVRPPALGVWLGRRWSCRELQHPLVGLAAGIEMRTRWQDRAARAGVPSAWRCGWRGGNKAFRECLRRRSVAQPGSASALGAERRWFESSRTD